MKEYVGKRAKRMKNKRTLYTLITAVFILFAALLFRTGSRFAGNTEFRKAAIASWPPKNTRSFTLEL